MRAAVLSRPPPQSHFSHPRVAEIARSEPASAAARAELLRELLDLHTSIGTDPEVAGEVRRAVLGVVGQGPDSLGEERVAQFLAEHVEPEDFARTPWRSTEGVVRLYEGLYGYQTDAPEVADRVRTHAQHLLRAALLQLESEGRMETMIRLLQVIPTSTLGEDRELLRLRNRALLYETRRVQRNRRLVHGFLALQVLLVLVVFPLLFVYAENGAIQVQIEKAADVELPGEQRQFLSYLDGLYWSLITAASIGYGDVTPVTGIGRGIAAALGVLGVVTVGVIAGLILNWITPRRLL